MKNLLAKSRGGKYMYLEEHTEHVVAATVHFAKAYSFDLSIAKNGAILHDLGKGHPAFQAMLIEKPNNRRDEWLSKLAGSIHIKEELVNRDIDQYSGIRHELASLGFLSLFPKKQWPFLIEMVVAHHKSVYNDKSGRGLLDLIEEYGDADLVIEQHLRYWESWALAAIEVAASFDIPTKKIDLQEATENFKFAIEYVKNISDGWSDYRGLLMSADHFGSGYKFETENELKKLFKVPNLMVFEKRSKSPKAHLYPLSGINIKNPKPHTLVTAPTGAGKTDFLIRRCKNRIFYTLPFQASINAMFLRLRSDLPDADIRRVHAASKVELDEKSDTVIKKQKEIPAEDVDLQQHPGASIKVMTPHQISALVFCTPGHEAIALDIRGQDVILDEVHTFSAQSQTMVLQIVKVLKHHGCHIHVGTATLPTVLKDKLIEIMGGEKEVYEVSLEPKKLDQFDRHQIFTKYENHPIDYELLKKIVGAEVENKKKILLVANRVKTAQRWFSDLQKIFSETKMALIHSRFRRKDRASLEKQIIALQEEGQKEPCIAISTQVVEVSLDISYDLMITEAAPLDALIQRFGRVNRRRSDTTIGKYKPIYILKPAETEKEIKPYDKHIIDKSYALFTNGEVFQEQFAQKYIDEVFTDLNTSDITHHYKFTEQGEYDIGKLEHQARKVIVDALEIEGSTCILLSELEAYRNASARVKPKYEIPVSARFGLYQNLPVEESGSYPFIISDERYLFDQEPKLGLIDKKQLPIKNQIL